LPIECLLDAEDILYFEEAVKEAEARALRPVLK
jgi:hypothetical protein